MKSLAKTRAALVALTWVASVSIAFSAEAASADDFSARVEAAYLDEVQRAEKAGELTEKQALDARTAIAEMVIDIRSNAAALSPRQIGEYENALRANARQFTLHAMGNIRDARRGLDRIHFRNVSTIVEVGPRASRNSGGVPFDKLLKHAEGHARFARHFDGKELEKITAVDPSADHGQAGICKSSELEKAWKVGTLQALNGMRHLETAQQLFTSRPLEACIEMVPKPEKGVSIEESATQLQRQARYCCQQGFRVGRAAFKEQILDRDSIAATPDLERCRTEYRAGRELAEKTICSTDEISCHRGGFSKFQGCLTTGFLELGKPCETAHRRQSGERLDRVATKRRAPEFRGGGETPSSGAASSARAPASGTARD